MQAIDQGVEKYVQKPLSPQELRQVVEEVLEKNKHQQPEEKTSHSQVFKKGAFEVDEGLHRVLLSGEKIDLTPSEFNLIVHLLRNDSRVVSPEELVEVVRGYKPDDAIEARQIIKWYVHRVRQKIEIDSSVPKYILNVRGIGYRIRPGS